MHVVRSKGNARLLMFISDPIGPQHMYDVIMMLHKLTCARQKNADMSKNMVRSWRGLMHTNRLSSSN